MKYAIEILTTKLSVLDNTYEKFVVQGSVDENSLSATNNREKAKELKEAIELLKNKQNNIPISESDALFDEMIRNGLSIGLELHLDGIIYKVCAINYALKRITVRKDYGSMYDYFELINPSQTKKGIDSNAHGTYWT
jgi:hypothetical protein